MSDRTVHGELTTADGITSVVRYNRAGKWRMEWVSDGEVRSSPLDLDAAVRIIAAHPRAVWHDGRPGGRIFDARMRKAHIARKGQA